MINPTEKLNSKDYSKLSYQFMAFGSIMNGLQHRITGLGEEEVRDTIDDAFQQSKRLVSDFVDELYDGKDNGKAEQTDQQTKEEPKIF